MPITLQDPRAIILEGATQQLLAQASSSIEELNTLRPFDPEIATRLRDALLPDRIVATLNMEGIVATRRQTLAVMDAMRIHESVGKGEREIFNALTADEFVADAVDGGIRLSEQFIREINRLLLLDVDERGGILRTGPVELPGAPVPPPEGFEVVPLTAQLCEYFNVSEALHPILQAAWLHAQFTQIHPFYDGNGRTGRLLQDYVLIRRGYLPIGIPPAQRDDYYSALECADGGDWNDLVEMLAILELSMISRAQAVVAEAKNRTTWIKKLSSAAALKRENSLHKSYLVWRKRMELISDTFAQTTRELDDASDVIGAEIREYGVVDFQDWMRICKRGQIDRSWLFSILFFAGGHPFYKAIGYLKRHVPKPSVDPFPPPKDAIGLFFTGVAVPSQERPDFLNYSDPHIRLREVLAMEDQQYVYRQKSLSEAWEISDLSSPGLLAEELFTDAFERKAGLGA